MSNLSAQDALTRLQQGNERFVGDQLVRPRDNSARRRELTGGQNPYAIVLSCADSRVIPELAFDEGLGDLFIIRVAGNIANTETIASIEYAVAHLGVNLIVVMGHEACGAVGAALKGGDNGHNLNQLVAHIQPALSACESSDVNQVVKKNAELTAKELFTRSPIIQDAIEKRGLEIRPAYYNLGTGQVEFLR